MSKGNTGGPAFPVPDISTNGMTLRDYFAAKAMQSFLVNANIHTVDLTYEEIAQKVARLSFVVADAMLEEKFRGCE